MSRSIGENSTRREFLKHAAVGGALAMMSPAARALGANERVRVGMIGAGARGQELLREVLALRNVQVVAIADAYSRRREEAAGLVPHVETLDDHRRLLERHDIDGVIVATPLHLHAQHFVDALVAGKDLRSGTRAARRNAGRPPAPAGAPRYRRRDCGHAAAPARAAFRGRARGGKGSPIWDSCRTSKRWTTTGACWSATISTA